MLASDAANRNINVPWLGRSPALSGTSTARRTIKQLINYGESAEWTCNAGYRNTGAGDSAVRGGTYTSATGANIEPHATQICTRVSEFDQISPDVTHASLDLVAFTKPPPGLHLSPANCRHAVKSSRSPTPNRPPKIPTSTLAPKSLGGAARGSRGAPSRRTGNHSPKRAPRGPCWG